MSDDFMELNDMELNYINWWNGFWWHQSKYQTWSFFLSVTKEVYSFYLNILTETFVLNLCSFNIAENANIVGTAFWQKRQYLQSFQF